MKTLKKFSTVRPIFYALNEARADRRNLDGSCPARRDLRPTIILHHHSPPSFPTIIRSTPNKKARTALHRAGSDRVRSGRNRC